MLKIENLSKVYDDGTKALHNLSLEVPDGQFLVSAGPAPKGRSYLAVWNVSDGSSRPSAVRLKKKLRPAA